MLRLLVTRSLAGALALALLSATSSAQSSPVVFAGFDHQAMGGASLVLDPTRTLLTVEGLASSGDGLSYQLDAEAGEIRFGDGIRGSRPPSGSWNVRATYRYGTGASGEVHGGVDASGGPLVTFDFAPAGVNALVGTLLKQGQIVHETTFGPFVTLGVFEWPAEVELAIEDGEVVAKVRWDAPVSTVLPGGAPVSCDEAIVRSATGGSLAGEEIGTVFFDATGLDQVEFEGERFRSGNEWFEVEGNMQLERSPLGHQLTHVVQQGGSGVYTEFRPDPCLSQPPERETLGLTVNSLLTQGPPVAGTRMDFLCFGELDGLGVTRIPTHSKEWTDYNTGDPGMTLIGGFTELGATSWTVQVFDDGLLVDSETGLSATVARVKEYVFQHEQADLDFLHQRAAAHIDLGGDQEVTILSDPPRTILGDRVHIIPEGIQLFPDCVAAIGMLTLDVPDATLAPGILPKKLGMYRLYGLGAEVTGDAILKAEGGGVALVNEAWGPLATGPLAGGMASSISGLKGIRLELPGALDPSQLPEGSRRSFRLTTEDVTGLPGSAGLDLTVENGRFAITHDLDDLGSTDADVEAWLGDQQVYSGIMSQQGRVLVDADIDEASVLEGDDTLVSWQLAWDTPQDLVIDGQPVQATRISERLRHRDRAITIHDFELLATDTPGTSIGRASVRPHNAWWSAVGDVAFVDFSADPILLDLLDPDLYSGLEVQSETDPQGNAYVQLSIADPALAEILDGDEDFGFFVQEEDGAAGAGPAIAPGQLILDFDGTRWNAAADFAAAGYASFRVLADDGSEVQVSPTSATGSAFSCDAWPVKWTFTGADEVLRIHLAFDGSAQVGSPSSGIITTSSLSILVERADRPAFGAGLVRFLSRGLSTMAASTPREPSAVDDDVPGVDRLGDVLLPAQPNPFNPRAELRFNLAQGGPVRLNVHDVTGRRVRTLIAGTMPAGPGAVFWDGRDDQGRDMASGVYFARLVGPSGIARTKLVLVR